MGTDKKRAPIIDEETAPIVRRIFEMYASGLSPNKITEILNLEGIPSPATYAYTHNGQKSKPSTMGLWAAVTIRDMLDKIIYIGHMPQLCWTSISYKNHKKYKKDKNEWSIVYNNHEPIVSQELWDRVQERKKSVAKGKKTKMGFTHPLSGFLFCADCGGKMKLCTSIGPDSKRRYYFNCGHHLRYGKAYCFSHHISASALEEIVLDDIRTMANRIVLDEKAIREEFVRRNAELADVTIKKNRKDLQIKQKRAEELTRLIQTAYEDKVKGKIPEDICIGFIEKYSLEQKTIAEEIEDIQKQLVATETTRNSADDFIRDIKKYLNAPELTREMCYELIDRIIVGGSQNVTGKECEIEIVYKIDIVSVLRHKVNK